jgi:signal transduction histidine kinase/CheY-like chemotaxis protein
MGDAAQKPWRDALVQRLLPITVVFGCVGLAAVMVVANTRVRAWFAVLWAFLGFLAVAAKKRHWPYRARASALVGFFAVATFLGYAVAGFHGNAALGGGGCVILTGLLFGRKPMLGVLAALLAAATLAAAGMLSGALALPPPHLVSLTEPGPWARTTIVAGALWAVLGLSVTYFVEHLEKVVRTEHEALVALRAEQARREHAEAQRAEAERVAQQAQKLELVGRLSAGVAHDFNNVLAVIQAWSELAHNPDSEARQGILAAVRQGTALAQQLLAFGRQSIRSPRDLRLDQAVDATVKLLRRVVPAGVNVLVEHGDAGFVSTDETELQQVVVNFVVNARDAMPMGGRLRVQTGVEVVSEERPVVGGTLVPGRWAFVSVADSGTGIDPPLLDRIFEPFFTTKPVGMGTGLGLATVLHIARESGGAVAVQSRPGAGARFTFYLPEARPNVASPRAEHAARVSADHRRAARILVFEDSVPVRELMRSALEGLGHTVVSVADGPRAMEALRSPASLDMLCVDAVVPGERASEVIAAFEVSHPLSPVLVVSDHVQEEPTRRGIEQGRYRLLRKPFAADELCGIVDELLSGNAKRAEPPPPAQAKRVLVVDDDPLGSDVLCHFLRAAPKAGRVRAAARGRRSTPVRADGGMSVPGRQLGGRLQ